MTQYTTPVTTAFELQREAIKQGKTVFEQTIDFQQRMNEAAIKGLEQQESAQRRGLELAQKAFDSYLDAIDSTVPGSESTVEELRSAADDQFEFLLENQASAYENVESEFSEGIDAYDEMSSDSLEMLDEQLSTLIEVHEDLESQSVEAVEDAASQVEVLQEQVQDVQQQVQDVQEQATDAVEA